MSETGDLVRLAAATGQVHNLRAGYELEFPDEDERLAVTIRDAIEGFAAGGASIHNDAKRIGVALAAGLRQLGVVFGE